MASNTRGFIRNASKETLSIGQLRQNRAVSFLVVIATAFLTILVLFGKTGFIGTLSENAKLVIIAPLGLAFLISFVSWIYYNSRFPETTDRL